jgi:hydrogenase-4 component B
MPLTGAAFLIGSMAISALPPFNGFFSEWLTYQSLLQGAVSSGLLVQWVLLLGVGSLALTGGLALACFVKAFGATFLARPRTQAMSSARESSWWMQTGMVGLTILCIALGLGAGQVIVALQAISQHVTRTADIVPLASNTPWQALSLAPHSTIISAPVIATALAIGTLAAWLWSKYGVYRRQKIETGLTWDCGTDLTGRMEITSTGFARSIILIFQGILRPTIQHTLEYDDAASRYTPKSRSVDLHITDVYRKYTYTPIYEFSMNISRRVKAIQNGNLNAYVLYIFMILVVLLLVGV